MSVKIDSALNNKSNFDICSLLEKGTITVTNKIPGTELDIFLVVLDKNRIIEKISNFIYYKNVQNENGSIVMDNNDTITKISYDLSKLTDFSEVIIFASYYNATDRVRSSSFNLDFKFWTESGTVETKHILTTSSGSAIEVCKIYKRKGNNHITFVEKDFTASASIKHAIREYFTGIVQN